MDDQQITRAEHEEFCRRIDRENERQNKRLDLLEDDVRQLNNLTASIKELAISVQNMCKEQERQSERLRALEKRDGEMWRKVVGYVITTVIGVGLGFIFTHLGLQ